MTRLPKISDYSTLIFDCDGVVLDSNKVKTNAFYRATLSYGENAAKAMVKHHVASGGVSRYKKFDYFLKHIASTQSRSDLDILLKAYAEYVYDGLLSCPIAAGIERLREYTSSTRWLIVSGGDQTELRDIFDRRKIGSFFDGGIFGSPDDKIKIMKREVLNQNIVKPALFLGDSKYDYEASLAVGIDFVFLTQWTEVQGWRQWVQKNDIVSRPGLKELIDA